MKIRGVQITEAQIEACISRMANKPFTAAVIANVAGLHGVSKKHCLADRLIQKFRKAGKIKVGQPYPTWKWVGK